jgi:hypothetical protein
MGGKFRVKANRARSSGLTISVRRNLFQSNEPARFVSRIGILHRLHVFLLGRSAVITDNESIQNSGFSGRMTGSEKARSRDDARR